MFGNKTKDNAKVEKQVNPFKRMFISSILSSVLMLILGVMMLIWPIDIQIVLIRVISVLLMVFGIIGLSLLISAGRTAMGIIGGTGCAIMVVLGIILMISPALMLGFLNIIFGIMILFYGVSSMYQSAMFAKSPYTIVIASIQMVLGIVIIANPFSSAAILMIIIGITLIYNAIAKIIIVVTAKKYMNNYTTVAYETSTSTEIIESTAREIDVVEDDK